jgi:hypothetical protein
MEKKQTAVEWLINQFLEVNVDSITNENMYIKIPTKAFKQAKEMEKEQIVEAYDAGLFDGTMDDVNDRMHKQYYNETYGSKD